MTDSGASSPPCGICGLIDRIRGGKFDDLIAELTHSYVILGDAQFYRGYCALLFKRHATSLHELPPAEAHGWFDEILSTASSIDAIVKPARVNYECLGNQEPHLHWHIFPRTAEDPMRLAPVWLRPEGERKVSLEIREKRKLIDSLRAELSNRRPA
jgi:diadenosine tetraphosphate (Ap4A) HIT family hydrolase